MFEIADVGHRAPRTHSRSVAQPSRQRLQRCRLWKAVCYRLLNTYLEVETKSTKVDDSKALVVARSESNKVDVSRAPSPAPASEVGKEEREAEAASTASETVREVDDKNTSEAEETPNNASSITKLEFLEDGDRSPKLSSS
ncbi:hypothetical protein HYDPIDRAFT_116046 [Hydnomerulius pinastri MD-312]|uniref:Uncharacterized protein n=1 Tax=Hydnomerulius pinastri MD-312 TaxID=994086 RepID=A0A0C9V6Q5_9AGAM|nr:hypothetical protein HYDPIDRAFT_116046 [Hydnomerulius pinastri MD-312]